MPFSGSGSGTEISPYEITSWAQLNEVRDYLSDYFILMNDLSPSNTGYDTYASSSANGGAGWLPIGESGYGFWLELEGTTGDTYTITTPNGTTSALDYDATPETVISALGTLGYSLTKLDEYVDGAYHYYDLGGVPQGVTFEVDDSNISEYVQYGNYADNEEVSFSFDGGGHTISGIVIYNLKNSYSGFVSRLSGTIDNLHLRSASIFGVYSSGILIGRLLDGSLVTNCSTTGEVSSPGASGGLIGIISSGSITNCYSDASISSFYQAGGLIGQLYNGIVENCYSKGSVDCDSFSGGFIGQLSGLDGTITSCYSTTSVQGSGQVGGFCGNTLTPEKITGCFWDTETSGQITSYGGIGKTTEQMKDINLYITIPESYIPPTTIVQNDRNSGWVLYGGTTTELNQQVGQSFVATASSIYSVKIYLYWYNEPTDDLVVTITSSIGGSSLGSKSINASMLLDSKPNEFVFDTPVTVTPSNTYYIQISRSGARDETNYFVIGYYNANVYASGQFYLRSNSTWSGTGYTNQDLFFTITNGDMVGHPSNLVTPWDIEELSAYTNETWKIVDGSTYPMLGYQDYAVNTGAFFAFL